MLPGTKVFTEGRQWSGFLPVTDGGGVCIIQNNGTFSMSGNPVISHNTAAYGGGVAVGDGAFIMTGGTIYGANASSDLANVSTITPTAAVYVEGGTFSLGTQNNTIVNGVLQ
jgi:hypothetical protein